MFALHLSSSSGHCVPHSYGKTQLYTRAPRPGPTSQLLLQEERVVSHREPMCLWSSRNINRFDNVTRTKQCVHWVIIRRESSTQSSPKIIEMRDLWRICFHYPALANWMGMTLQMSALSENRDFAVYTKSMVHRWNSCFWYKHKIRILSLYYESSVLTISSVLSQLRLSLQGPLLCSGTPPQKMSGR